MKQHKPIIIKKKKGGGHGHHGGAWKIALADFMTAMMAFFLVMWLIAVASPQELTMIAEYFRTPLKVTVTGGKQSSSDDSIIPGGGQDASQTEGVVRRTLSSSTQVKQNKEVNNEDFKRNIQDRGASKNQKTEAEATIEQLRLEKLQSDLQQAIRIDPRLRELQPQLLIDLVDQGLRIQIVDSQNRPMFKRGSDVVEPYMRDILRALAPIINEVPNKISLAGHTDDYQFATGELFYSNWELSTDRANSSRRELMAGGLSTGKLLRIVGMADTMNLNPLNSSDPKNRRISIIILNKQAQESIERENQEGIRNKLNLVEE
ncbi:flagellar motor protein MotB [Thorsellia kenyensis]|uniref:Flagellar motor protein MotB n=1 Tax=Thorsellia kenyensis TaxID=1549888 RepID=A0ABV6C8V7_9GAMM